MPPNVKRTNITIKIDNELIHESSEEKLVGVKLDKFYLLKHVLNLFIRNQTKS